MATMWQVKGLGWMATPGEIELGTSDEWPVAVGVACACLDRVEAQKPRCGDEDRGGTDGRGRGRGGCRREAFQALRNQGAGMTRAEPEPEHGDGR